MTEAEFRKHFSRQGAVTDCKIMPHRRIGYVGYKTHEHAASALKYFNKTFIRMSRIGVELARPVRLRMMCLGLCLRLRMYRSNRVISHEQEVQAIMDPTEK